jgi:hypothetical protein
MNDKVLLSRAELELTQRIQLHFPVRQLSPETVGLWNKTPMSILSAKILEASTIKCVITTRFNPGNFNGLDKSWKLIPEEHDSRCPDIIVDSSLIKLAVMIQSCESDGHGIRGEEKLKRLKSSGNIRLTADWFLFFRRNQNLIPKEWGEVSAVYFDGDVLLHNNCRWTLLLQRRETWQWDCESLGNLYFPKEPSAVLNPLA